MITTYLQLAPDVAVMKDNIGQTPLHMLCSVPYISDGQVGAIRAYLSCSNGKRAVFMTDNEGRTPLECMFEKSYNKLFPLVCESFLDFMVWWYGCLDIDLLLSKWKLGVDKIKWIKRCKLEDAGILLSRKNKLDESDDPKFINVYYSTLEQNLFHFRQNEASWLLNVHSFVQSMAMYW